MANERKAAMSGDDNLEQSVPFFMVKDLAESLRFYVDGLGFRVTKSWEPEGAMAWCWLQQGGAALMLQELRKPLKSEPGAGVSICFQCKDALAIHRATRARGLHAMQPPFVGNNMWVVSFEDPDGYRLDFESPTDVPEETVLGEE